MLGGSGTVGYHSLLIGKLNRNRGIVLYAPELSTSQDPKNMDIGCTP